MTKVTLAAVCMILLFCTYGNATPFALIVPSSMTLNSFAAPGGLSGGQLGGWIAALNEPIGGFGNYTGTLDAQVTSDNPDMSLQIALIWFGGVHAPTAMAPGTVAGQLGSVDSAGTELYAAELMPNETLLPTRVIALYYTAQILYPVQYVGSAHFNVRFGIESDAVSYGIDVTTVSDPNSSLLYSVTGAQRVNSMEDPTADFPWFLNPPDPPAPPHLPEPSSLALLGFGLAGLFTLKLKKSPRLNN